MMTKKFTQRILPLAGVLVPSLAYAVSNGGWNVDFNSDTVGQPPATAAYTDGAVNTAPKSISNAGVDTVLVTDALAGLDDQPVVLTNADATTGSGGTSSIPALEFGTGGPAWPENGGPGISVIEWDMSIASGDASGGRIFSIRFQNGGGLLFGITLRGVHAGSGNGSIAVEFITGTILNKGVTWAHDDPMRVRVEINKNLGEFRVWWDSSFHNNELVQHRRDSGLAGFNVVQFRDMGGLGGEPVEFEAAIDNFFTPEFIYPSEVTAPSVAFVEFESVEDAVYNLQATTDLIGGLFNPVGATVTGSGNLMTLYDDDTSSTTKSYRIVGNQ